MPRPAPQLKGGVYGSLTVTGLSTKAGYWTCLCACGRAVSVRGTDLNRGKSRSCGCSRTIHGQTGSPEYSSWRCMKYRINHPEKYPAYAGLTYSPEWEDFTAFYRGMGSQPPNTTLDRINPMEGYSLDNCRWATNIEQQENKRSSKNLSAHFGGYLLNANIATWAKWLRDMTGNREWTSAQLTTVLKTLSIQQIIGAVHPDFQIDDSLLDQIVEREKEVVAALRLTVEFMIKDIDPAATAAYPQIEL